MLHDSFPTYRNYRWMWLTTGLTAVVALAYFYLDPPGGHNGGTWFGYSLGALCLAIMFWLMAYSRRKRSYAKLQAPLAGWLSAHVYLGAALLVLVPLHCGFQFGWNVHTFAYALLCLAIVSGFVGFREFTNIPREIVEVRPNRTRDRMWADLEKLDRELVRSATLVPLELATLVLESVTQTDPATGLVAQLSGSDWGGKTDAALCEAKRMATPTAGDRAEEVKALIDPLQRKISTLRSLSRNRQLTAKLNAWRVAHVPLAVCSLVAVLIHVFVVLYQR